MIHCWQARGGAYADAFGADSVVGDAQLRLYRFAFSVDGVSVDVPSGTAVTASSSTGSGFVPVRSMPFHWQSSAAELGSDAGVERNSGVWSSTIALAGTDMVLFATAPHGCRGDGNALPRHPAPIHLTTVRYHSRPRSAVHCRPRARSSLWKPSTTPPCLFRGRMAPRCKPSLVTMWASARRRVSWAPTSR